MATKKVKVPSSWNAKPVTKVGGGSGGVRKPSSPYSSVKRPLPSSERLPLTPKPKSTAKPAAKTKIELLREAAKTKPKSPAPRGTATPKPTAKPATKPNSKTLASRGKAGISMPNSSRAGINLPRAAVNALPKPIGPTTKGMTPTAKPTVKPRGIRGLNGSQKLGLEALGIPTGVASAAIRLALSDFGSSGENPDVQARRMGFKDAEDRRRRVEAQKAKEGGGSKPKKPARPASDYEKLFQTGGSRANYGLDKKDDPDRKREPVAPLPASVRKPNSSSSGSSTPSRGSSTQSRSSSSSSSASPSTSTSGTPAKPGQKWSDFNPGRGTSKTNNPLMKDMIKRMKDREDKEQASKAQQLTDKSRQNSGYSSAEKVDGSKYADELKKKKSYNSSVSHRLRHPSSY
jgi:hypothetical protein